MLDRIIHFSLHNRIFVLFASALLIVAGIYVGGRTEVDVFPDLNAPTVVVMTEARGMAAEEVERLVTFPLETALNGATDVRRVRSSSTNGFSVIWVEFDWGTEIFRDRQIVSEKLAAAKEQLPEGVGQPTLGAQSSVLGEVLIIGLTAQHTDMMTLRTLADRVVRPRLMATEGVAQVSVLGGDVKEYQILLRTAAMQQSGVTLSDVLEATRDMNRNSNGGAIYDYGNEYIVRGIVATNDVNALGDAVVKNEEGSIVRLSDIATLRIGAQEPKTGSASERGKQAVLLTVSKQPGASTLEMTQKLEEELQAVQKHLPTDIQVSTNAFRQARFIESAIKNIRQSLFEGSVFVVLVLFLFLANVRTTFISLLSIPLSLLITLVVMHFWGLSVNTMSLGGMAIAIGSLVDDAIVDVENVVRNLRLNAQLPKTERKAIREVVFKASREVRMPILNSTLVVIVSFLPLFLLSGMEGCMLIPLGIAFIVSLLASTLVALTLTPVLSSYLLKVQNEAREAKVSAWLKRHYKELLERALNKKRSIAVCSLGLTILALIIYSQLGHSFLPPFNEGSLTVNVSLLPGVSLEESERVGQRAEQLLMQLPEIETVVRKTGRAELDEHALGVNVSELEAPFRLKDRSHEAFMDDVRHRLNSIPGANIEIGQPITHRIDAMLSGTRASIAIKLFGTDLNRMYSLAQQIHQVASGVEGVVDLNVEQLTQRPEIKIVPRRKLLAEAGISLASFNDFVKANLAGEVVSQVFEDGQNYNLVVKAETRERHSIQTLGDLEIYAARGKRIPLSSVADILSTVGPSTINRENAERKIVVSANTSGRDLRSVVNEIQQRVSEQVQLPEGYHISYGGQFENEQAASRTLLIASLVSICVIYVLLFMQLRDLRLAAIVMLNLPLALIGGVMSIWMGNGIVSIPAIIGFISLFGIATRNGMLLLSHYQTLQSEHIPLRQRILQGSIDRLPPILMTALTSALALIPLALQGSLSGNEIQSPMAKVILGGLLTSTLLNVFLIPVVYEWMYQKVKKN